MATNIYSRKTVDGKTTFYNRKGTQGAPIKPVEIRKVYKTYTMSPTSLPIIAEKAKSMRMSISSYVELAAVLYNPIKD